MELLLYPATTNHRRQSAANQRLSEPGLFDRKPPPLHAPPPRLYNAAPMPDSATWTVRRLLEWTTAFFTRKEVDSPRLSAELLLAHVLKLARIRLYTDYERPLSESELTAYRELVRRAGEHEPIAYLTGIAHFFDIELLIRPPVLIPRPDTETLVENVLHFVKQTPGLEAPRILDLCTGSGCIACTLAKHLPASTIAAVDLDPAAASLARENVEKLALAERVKVYEGDLFEALPGLSLIHI